MTFETFKKIAESKRSDIKVSRHGDYCNNKSKNTLGIIFIKDGRESKVYDYSGTYAEVLNKLGIKTVTSTDYAIAKGQLDFYKKNHGTESFFSNGLMDYSKEIQEYEEKIAKYESNEYIREWEVK